KRLTGGQRDLLRSAAEDTAGAFTLSVQDKQVDVDCLRQFLQQPYVHKSDEWLKLFQSEPPRGVLSRIARRLDVALSPVNGPWQYPDKQDFRDEIARMISWYEPGRKKLRRARNLREDEPVKMVPGATTVFTTKVREHYAKLSTALKIEGLWKWATVARGLHKAGVPVVSGTISVEQKWSHINSMLPQESRTKQVMSFLRSKIHMRVLQSKWARAVADGKKWVETQRYRERSLNAMKFAAPGEWVVMGDSQHVTAIAVCAGSAVRGCTDIVSSGVLDRVDESLRPDLESYLSTGQSFDYIAFSSVCSLKRVNPIPWKTFWALEGAKNPKNKQGFPRVGGPELAPTLFFWAKKLGAKWIDPYGDVP
ncbi:unnamed protein product, partial [Effrenium voratum]